DTGNLNIQVIDKTGALSGTTNMGAIVSYIGDSNASQGSSGTGVFDPFVRLQGTPTEQGFNTNAAVTFDAKSGTWTHAIKVSGIPVVPCPTTATPGQLCWELWNDVNENNSTPYISLNR